MVAVHCAALPATLLESELFGHEKGAFTGAHERRIGRFEQANGSTLFLDEIGELDASTQVKLLRVLGERTFERVGSNKTISVDVRLIAASNKNLAAQVKAGAFREDLYFRLRVVELWLPPLRERSGDVPLLALQFLRETAKQYGKHVNDFTIDALQALVKYRWPANVRELRNAIEGAVALCRGDKITLKDLPPNVRWGGEGPAPSASASMLERGGLSLQEAEKQLVARALEEAKGNRKLAAQKLGISRRTLHRKLHSYHLDGF
jgi:DNA-binding NtrC family response regulator